MGTNYYFITKNKHIAHDYFEGEYDLVDEPDFRYEIHLNKCSCGWKPVLENHKSFQSFADLEKFYYEYQEDIRIEDEYQKEFTFEEYKEILINHSQREPQPMKWVYKKLELFGWALTTEKCSPEEAELWIPFDHMEYTETRSKAQEKFGVYEPSFGRVTYHRDPDYNFDWSDGRFS